MQIRIVTITTIDCTTGETESKSQWRLEGEESGIGSHVAAAASALSRVTETARGDPLEGVARSGLMTRCMGLASAIGLAREEVDAALRKRPPGRVHEVLEWIRGRKSKETIRSVPALFWSLVSKD